MPFLIMTDFLSFLLLFRHYILTLVILDQDPMRFVCYENLHTSRYCLPFWFQGLAQYNVLVWVRCLYGAQQPLMKTMSSVVLHPFAVFRA